MKISIISLIVALGASSVAAFSTVGVPVQRHSAVVALQSTAGSPPATSEPSASISETDIPTNLPSECGMDYIPLATMLATGQLAEADQVRLCFVNLKETS